MEKRKFACESAAGQKLEIDYSITAHNVGFELGKLKREKASWEVRLARCVRIKQQENDYLGWEEGRKKLEVLAAEIGEAVGVSGSKICKIIWAEKGGKNGA